MFITQSGFGQKDQASYAGVSPETKILMSDNTEKRIIDIKEGDSVITYLDLPPFNITFMANKVKKIIQKSGPLYSITSKNKSVTCTENLGFFCKDFLWASINPKESNKIFIDKISSKLEIGNELYHLKDNKPAFPQLVNLIEIVPLPIDDVTDFYTLELEYGNTFIANGFIVKTK
ncbi:MAG: hypothetical protein IPJ81_18860 [Chitinophagaceae bacterium]|nr:hypothetical protein [Chitinophagaceae bacterium]